MKTSDLRVTSGQYRGQKLRSPENALTHPMGAREKLALFNLLQPYLDASSKVLDLYAGSGALGIEALSRGVEEVVFVEKTPKIAHLISENLSGLSPRPSTSTVFPESVASFCERPEYLSYFDIVIADPPYDNFHPEDLASITQILSENGVFILSSPAKADPPELPGGIQQETTRTYAGARLTVYRK